MKPRIEPAERPYAEDMERTLSQLMPPGVEPLLLFRVLARDPRLFRRFMAGGLLDRGTLSLREREIAIDRTTARCGAEYEWGVHVAIFGPRVGFGAAEQRAIVLEAGADAECWTPSERLIVRLMDQLHDRADMDDALFAELRAAFRDEQILELLLLAGFYHTVSYLVNALRLPLEAFGARFPVTDADAETEWGRTG
jgi:alkylhydroperoxidase family enzyme